MDESKMVFARAAQRALVGPLTRATPRLGKGILAAACNPTAPGLAPCFRPPVLSLFRSESA